MIAQKHIRLNPPALKIITPKIIEQDSMRVALTVENLRLL
jgi:hypothetical protein